MSYEYTDVQGLKLRVTARNINSKDCVSLGMPLGGDDGAVWREFPVDDAPAIALAILEAAGITDKNDGGKLGAACLNLRGYVQGRKAEAEREAEDAKVREFIQVTRNYTVSKPNESDRKMYRAAREFFAKEGN